ncbi:Membrane-bound lytic murein transglycosylase B precursor [Pannonibacter phragmitetus]|uniref:Membrane-bound lytic murein transglycosylase B n=1 Tax=Pannonibacter phragmitetus TaxID=121719 RepID=A0A378ZT52_9HYPH|nr:lytic murein transglycosylase [Pannonibacter phragmitetus]SUB00432.1 Membrane-bound lytic murein transglycosylase B precursor [Pannonibacter phragmitetus]
MKAFSRSSLIRTAALALLTGLTATPAFAAQQKCGGDFRAFLAGVEQEAVASGVPQGIAARALANARIDKKVLSRDRGQAVFKQTFIEFSARSVSSARLQHGANNMKKYAQVFARAEAEYGVPAAVITAFWGLETDFGAVQGDFNTFNALATLAHDCRRPHLFRPQLIAALHMVVHGDLDPATTTGAWAGEIGQVQMLPEDIIRYGVDGDGDNHVDLKNSAPDAILTAAKFIQSLGWQRGQPWLIEVETPDNLPWADSSLDKTKPVSEWAGLGVKARSGALPTGALPASLILPQGRKGPAFLAFPNFGIYLKWNQSFIYTTSAAYFATRLAGAPVLAKTSPEPGLDDAGMRALQTKLQARGHDVGKIDGILGSGTRRAVQTEQQRLGIPADGWPTPALLQRL